MDSMENLDMKAYFVLKNESNELKYMEVGATVGNYSGEKISQLKEESKIVIEFLSIPQIAEELFKSIGINYPFCWIGLEVQTSDFFQIKCLIM